MGAKLVLPDSIAESEKIKVVITTVGILFLIAGKKGFPVLFRQIRYQEWQRPNSITVDQPSADRFADTGQKNIAVKRQVGDFGIGDKRQNLPVHTV